MNYKKALEGLNEIEKKNIKSLAIRVLERADVLHKIGVCSLFLSDYAKAIENLRSADEIMIKSFFTKSDVYPKDLSYLADAHLKENHLKTAGEYGKKGREIYDINRISEDEEIL